MGRTIGLVAISVAILSMGSRRAIADDPPRAGPDAAKVDEILARWERQAAARKTLEVRFTRKDRSQVWGEEAFEGEIVIKDESSAAIRFTKPGEKGGAVEPCERLIWSPTELRQLDYRARGVFAFARPKDAPTRLPYLLRLPFLYGQTLADWKEHYGFQLVGEDDVSYRIWIKPRPVAPARSGWKDFLDILSGKYFPTEQELYRRALLTLDKQTLLPKSILMVAPNGKDAQDYRVSEIRCNEPIREDLFQVRDAGRLERALVERPLIGGPGAHVGHDPDSTKAHSLMPEFASPCRRSGLPWSGPSCSWAWGG